MKLNLTKEFISGKNDWVRAAELAYNCSDFKEDDEDEQVADELVSCYNCRYRSGPKPPLFVLKTI